MVKYTKKVSSILFMRAGKTEEIMDGYNNDYIKFTCPANWIDYALKYGNEIIGDMYDCSFANTREKYNCCVQRLTDRDGILMMDEILTLKDNRTAFYHHYYKHKISKPTLCYYTFKYDIWNNEYKHRGLQNDEWLYGDLDQYLKGMGFNEEEASYLFIHDTRGFINELKKTIVDAVYKSKDRLSDEGFSDEFDKNRSINMDDINYGRHCRNEVFIDNDKDNDDVIFWKLPEYAWQSEFRITIQNIHFTQNIRDDMEGYNYAENELKVYIPNLKKYASVVSAAKAHSVVFRNFDETKRTFEWNVAKDRNREIQ